ncbi:MAG: DUF1579 domain-containing protein [Pseudomonadota bacterium]
MNFQAMSMLIAATFVVTGTTFADTGNDHAHPLSFMFGEWVGEASGYTQSGPFAITQTERVGPMLDGDAVVIEGRGYAETGETMFNAFAVVSQTAAEGGWEMRSYAQGRAGTFPFELTDTGYVWSVPAGPNASMVYTAIFNDDVWQQIGEYTPMDGEPRQTFQMTLTRTSQTDWPASNPVSPTLAE